MVAELNRLRLRLWMLPVSVFLVWWLLTVGQLFVPRSVAPGGRASSMTIVSEPTGPVNPDQPPVNPNQPPVNPNGPPVIRP